MYAVHDQRIAPHPSRHAQSRLKTLTSFVHQLQSPRLYHRCCQVWDLRAGELLHQSAVLGSAPVTALASDPTFPRLAVGSADGTLRFFELAAPPACRCLKVGHGGAGRDGAKQGGECSRGGVRQGGAGEGSMLWWRTARRRDNCPALAL